MILAHAMRTPVRSWMMNVLPLIWSAVAAPVLTVLEPLAVVPVAVYMTVGHGSAAMLLVK